MEVRSATRDSALFHRGRLVRGHVHPEGVHVRRERRTVQPGRGHLRSGRDHLRPVSAPHSGRYGARAESAGHAGRGPRRVRLWEADMRREARRERYDVHRVRYDALGHGNRSGQGRDGTRRPRGRGGLYRQRDGPVSPLICRSCPR